MPDNGASPYSLNYKEADSVMSTKAGLKFLVVAISMLAITPRWSPPGRPRIYSGVAGALARGVVDAPAGTQSMNQTSAFANKKPADDEPEFAPIIERKLDFYDFNFPALDEQNFSLRDYVKGKSVVIVEYFAGWCKNSNRNGHVVERLWTKYRQRGLGVIGVAEYSDVSELRVHINRIGIDYPVVVETRKRDQRKDSLHYRYRRLVDDKRKWGTPFYVIIDGRDIVASGNLPLARRVFTVSGELVETEADQFIGERVKKIEPK